MALRLRQSLALTEVKLSEAPAETIPLKATVAMTKFLEKLETILYGAAKGTTLFTAAPETTLFTAALETTSSSLAMTGPSSESHPTSLGSIKQLMSYLGAR